ncbi:DnaJ domain-containing protein [Gilbertella persicaria]|uniref:DnaJ domain-containing protein n=1 Tax=Gilbertella persicaria TaxID=101096 RepID=UPI002220EAAE|nr:DnaJ domain-containing protein [Gilbertella persicaria]KAI8051385.1 DnaJ domain-containing protein [Gilbertella persicaria]
MIIQRAFSSTATRTKDFYKILQLTERADKKSIKANYYKLSKKYHPDLNPNNKEAHKMFLEINEAYAVLGNEASKRKYDNDRHDGDGMTNASRWSRATNTSNTQAWQHFRNRRARSTGSASAKEQAERMRQGTQGGFNYSEHYNKHYAAEEHRRRERMANAARRRREAGDDSEPGKRAPEMQNLWGRLWRLGIVLTGIAYATQALA